MLLLLVTPTAANISAVSSAPGKVAAHNVPVASAVAVADDIAALGLPADFMVSALAGFLGAAVVYIVFIWSPCCGQGSLLLPPSLQLLTSLVLLVFLMFLASLLC
jgi:hypothetical protein